MPQDHTETLEKLTEQVASLTAERDALKKTLADRDAAEAEAKAQAEEQEKNSLIEAALSDGSLYPAEQDVAKEMNLSLLKKHLASKKQIADLSRQTKDKPSADEPTHGLTEKELAICSKMHCSPEQYAATKHELTKRQSAQNNED